MKPFGVFLQGEIDKRHMSRREFASKVHSTHDTLHRYIEGDELPTLSFLRRLSGYTHIDLWTLLKITLPDEIPQPDTQVIRVAQLLDALPKQKREFFIELIEAANLGISQAGSNEGEITSRKKRKRSS